MNALAVDFLETTVVYVSAVVVVVLVFYFVYRKRKLLSEEIRLAIEQGQPFELPKINYFLHGVLWTIVGIILFISLMISTGDFGLSILGLLPTALGVAFLAFHAKSQREQQETHS